MKKNFHSLINRLWYEKTSPGLLAKNVHAWSARLIRLRRKRWAVREKIAFPVPIVVIGNVTVGGTGKTPLLMVMAQWLSGLGLRVGVVSRGYGARVTQHPFPVTAHTPPKWGGDEPCLIAKRLNIPVVIDSNRPRAVAFLLEKFPDVTIVLSDDGLQHYALERAVEVVVIDGQRRFGNGLCLPVGPLREPLERLSTASVLVINGGPIVSPAECPGVILPPQVAMAIEPEEVVRLRDHSVLPVCALREELKADFSVGMAVAGIGNPQRFFRTLKALSLDVVPRVFPDHHVYSVRDIDAFRRAPWVIMTEKDAIKMHHNALDNGYALRVNATLEVASWLQLATALHSQLQPWPDVSQALAQSVAQLKMRVSMHSGH